MCATWKNVLIHSKDLERAINYRRVMDFVYKYLKSAQSALRFKEGNQRIFKKEMREYSVERDQFTTTFFSSLKIL